MARRVEIECDICKGEPASAFGIEADDEKVTVDLCEKHAAPIRKAMEKGRPAVSANATPTVRALEDRVRKLPRD